VNCPDHPERSYIRWLVAAFLLLPVFLIGHPATGTAATVIKVSLVTPEGSTWTNSLHKLTKAVSQRTSGEITFKVYAGGISGDESDVLRKMRANRIHAAGFSGVGLGILLPKVRILEAPLLYSNYDQVDHVKEKLFDEFAADFEKKGFVLLGFAEAGFVYLFSSVKMSGPEGFDPLKMWVWKGDPVAKTSLEAFGIKTFPLHVTDVNTGLETGMINAFYSPPLAAVAFQWYSKVRYVLEYPIVNSTGAFLIKKRIFEKLSKANQKILREETRKFCDELVQLARKENAEALEVLKATGIEFEIPTNQQIRMFQESAQKIYTANTGKLYSRELFEKIKKILQNYQK
jgi:TRAP-type C4-dicarboxylate transport system substrate-binding protein